MKITSRIVSCLLLILMAACGKKDDHAPVAQLEGKWLLVEITGDLTSKGIKVTNKQEAIFQRGEYRLLVDDLQLNATTYKLAQINSSTGKVWQLKLANQDAYLIDIKDNMLHIWDPNPDALGLIYKREL
jgi:hypothetical protein